MLSAADLAKAAQAYERYPGAASGPLPSSYRRREPKRSILYEAVRNHWNTPHRGWTSAPKGSPLEAAT